MLLFEILLCEAGVIAAPLVELHRRVVAGVAEDDGSQFAFRRLDAQHRHVVIDWAPRIEAVDDAVGRRLAAVDGETGAALADPVRLNGACKELLTASDAILADRQALAAPLSTVAAPLTAAYGEIRHAALACMTGHMDERARHLTAAHDSMVAAAAVLKPYRLKP